MPELVANKLTSLPPEEVLVRAVQFFTNESWMTQSQTNRIATFSGVPKVAIIHWVLVVALAACAFVPGLIYYFVVLAKLRRLQNIAVTTTPRGNDCEVVVSYSPQAAKLVRGFLAVLPPPAVA